MPNIIRPINATREDLALVFTVVGHLDLDDLDDYGGYTGPDFHYEVRQVADALRDQYRERGFTFGFETDDDGVIGGGTVSAYLDTDSLYLTRWLDLRSLTTDREATGSAAAYAIAEALVNAYNQTAEFAVAHGIAQD